MVTKYEVQQFLNDFKTKLEIFDIIFTNRDKNQQALLELEITPDERKNYIKSLKAEDYFNGPTEDTFNPVMPHYWEFGINVKGKEVYVKINMGTENNEVICLSFHIAEREIKYPFK